MALAFGVLVLYVLLAPRITADQDAAEITLGLVTGGVLHPPGYPLFTLIGWGFVSLLRAFGIGYAFAANLWACAGAGVALLLLHRLALRLVRVRLSRAWRFALAALPVVVFGLNPQWTAESTIVEVHSWHLAWFAGTALLLARTIDDLPHASPGRMLMWGLVCGAGAAHQTLSLLSALVMTAALALALVRSKSWRIETPLLWIAGASLPLSSYAWLDWRAVHPGSASIWPTLEPTAAGVWAHITGVLYRAYIGRWHPDPEQAHALARDVYPFLWPGLLAFVLWLVQAREMRLVLGALLGAVILQLAVVYRYGVPDPVAYFLPPLAVSLLAWVPLGAWAAARGQRFLVAGALAVAIAALGVWGVRAAVERRRDLTRYDEMIRSMWQAVPDASSIFLWPADPYAKLLLYQRLEGQKPQVAVYNSAMLCNDAPARRFAQRYGFDPLANNGPSHARDTIEPRFMAGRHAMLDPRYLGRLHQTIADSAHVPVLLFDDTEMRLRRIDRRP